jgi:Phosphotransferase enzyme family
VPPPIAELISVVEEVRRRRRQGSATLDNALPRLELRPLAGGRNNLVFAWDGPHGEVCLKLYRTDKRDRAACEYQALTHVAACGITAAPEPLWNDPDPELPAVAMTMVAGQPLSDLAEPAAALRAAIAVLGQLREIPLGPFVDMPRVDSTTHCMERIIKVWPAQLEDCNREPLTVDMRSLLGIWEQRGDAAELVEHLSAHAIDDEQWISLLPDLGIVDVATRRRFLAAQRTVALRWLSVLWKRRNQRVDEFEFQFKRVRQLMNSDFL